MNKNTIHTMVQKTSDAEAIKILGNDFGDSSWNMERFMGAVEE